MAEVLFWIVVVFAAVLMMLFTYVKAQLDSVKFRLNWMKQDVDFLDKQMFRVRFLDPLNRAEHALDSFKKDCCGKCKERG